MRTLASVLALVLWLAGLAPAREALRLAPYKRVKLANGVTLMLMEKRGVPLVSFMVALRTGTTEDPPGKEGLAALTNDSLRRGTSARTAEQISAGLDFLGATFNTTESPDSMRVQAEFMKKDVSAGLALLNDLLRNPTFPQAEVEKLRQQRIDEIVASKDEAMQVIGLYYNHELFGAHPYGRAPEGDEKTLAAITRDDIAAFHRTHYVAGNLIVAAVGDFAAAEMEKTLSAQFGALPAQNLAPRPVADPARVQGKHLLLVDKPDSTQTFFEFGNVGIQRTNPDRVAIGVVNTLFGGRFTSFINTALRIQSGLTYGARSYFVPRRERGSFEIFSYTRNATTEKAIDMAFAVLREFHEKGPSEEQLKSAKEYSKGQYPPRIETSDQLANLLADFELYGLNESEVNDYYAKVDAVTLADAKRVIHEYFPADNFAIVLIGKASEIGPVVKKYATDFKTKSISHPGF